MTDRPDRRDLPLEAPFSGRIGRTYRDSQPDWPQPALAPEGAPHVLLILLDDVGFGHPATFGGPIEMPTVQRLAEQGLRYNQFHTAGICSPTRAALLTGRNHHAVGHGSVQRLGYPGYQWGWPRDAATVAETLRLNGYATGAFGKWHNTPNAEQSELGPFDSWPTSLGFDRFYGFHGGDCNQWEPPLVSNRSFVDRPEGGGYHLTEDLADQTIEWFLQERQLFPHRPVFMYFAPGAAHAPHHAPRAFIDKYRGAFDHGWDRDRELTFERQLRKGVIPEGTELTARPDAIPAWDSLSAGEQRVYARLQEAFAGMLEHTDHQIGRIVDALEEAGELDNTVIFYIVGDNGPAAETGLSGALNEYAYMNRVEHPIDEMERRIDEIGGPTAYNAVPAGWSWAGSTPFQWLKQVASHYGATRNPMVVAWGDKLANRESLRSQFHHVVDIAPTILDLAGVPDPASVHGVEQRPFDGVSMAYSFDVDGESRRRGQYFEVWGSRSLYEDGWLAGMRNPRLPWEFDDGPIEFDDDGWELYHVEEDFSQARDLAAVRPEKLEGLRSAWYAEADRNKVLPLEGRRHGAAKGSRGVPARRHFIFDRPVRRVPGWLAPDVGNRSHVIQATFVAGKDIEGTIVSLGGRFGGYGLYVLDGHLVYAYNLFDMERSVVRSSGRVPSGAVGAEVRFEADSRTPGTGGTVTLSINGVQVGTGRIDRTTAYHYSTETVFNIGESYATPVIEDFEVPFRFTGRDLRVEFFLHPEAPDVSAERDRVLRAGE